MKSKRWITLPAGSYLPLLLIGVLAVIPLESLRGMTTKHPISQSLPLESLTASSEASVQATIDNFSFGPKELTVKAGTTVQWTNKDDIPHTVTSDNGVFSSPVMDTNQVFQYTFAKPGKFSYHCKLHPSMTGVVMVQ
jgi:plastocyanin